MIYIYKCEQCKKKFEHFTSHRTPTNIKRFCEDCTTDKVRKRAREHYAKLKGKVK